MGAGGPEEKNVLIRAIDLIAVVEKACKRFDTSWLGFWLGGLWRKK
ncbi:MAG: hypothetical protein WC866_02735 [Patescibacteria group bacterium]|jgi:hypothetical protein